MPVQKLRCRVTRLTDHGEHVYTVDLAPERPAPRFKPGQFLHLALDEYDPSRFWPESRVFSIANAPSRRDLLRITYAVKGRFTSRMERELAQGKQVWVKLPYGEFVVGSSRDAVLFAGGTGMTAYTAFIEGLPSDYQHRLYLAYGARSPELLAYRDLVESQRSKVPSLHVFYFVEMSENMTRIRPANSGSCPQCRGTPPDNSMAEGCLSVAAIWPHVESPFQTDYYLSGPPQMIKALTGQLQEKGVSLDSIKVDAWE